MFCLWKHLFRVYFLLLALAAAGICQTTAAQAADAPAAAAPAAAATPAAATTPPDTIVLQSGETISGTIVKKTPSWVMIDIGYLETYYVGEIATINGQDVYQDKDLDLPVAEEQNSLETYMNERAQENQAAAAALAATPAPAAATPVASPAPAPAPVASTPAPVASTPAPVPATPEAPPQTEMQWLSSQLHMIHL